MRQREEKELFRRLIFSEEKGQAQRGKASQGTKAKITAGTEKQDSLRLDKRVGDFILRDNNETPGPCSRPPCFLKGRAMQGTKRSTEESPMKSVNEEKKIHVARNGGTSL